MKIDSYTLIARIFPAVISSVPFFVIHYFFLNSFFGKFWNDLLSIKFISDITFSLALFYFLFQLNRILAKELFEKRIYNDTLNFPTVDLVLHLNSYFSPEYIKKIHTKIRSNFGINIPSQHMEVKNGSLSRKRISEAMSHIRAKVGSGKLVQQHNAEYGFVRNLAGGSVFAIIMSFINMIIFKWVHSNKTAFIISIITFIIYGSFILFSKKIIKNVGRSYAKILIQEYMTE